MAKQIISPDGTLQIIRHRGTFPIMRRTQIQGAVENIGKEQANAKIKIDFFDAADNFIISTEEVLENIKPGETRLFDIGSEWSTIMNEIDSYKLSVEKVG